MSGFVGDMRRSGNGLLIRICVVLDFLSPGTGADQPAHA